MSKAPGFAVRGIEIHTRQMWEWEHVRRVLDFAAETGLNMLAFHENDLLDQVTCPESHLPREMMKRNFPVYAWSIENNRDYLRKVAANARERGVDFYLEVKELWYRLYLLETHPELMRDGAICPNNPFWWGFLRAKIEALFSSIPEVAGIIVSTASKESRLSLRNTRCRCEICRSTPPEAWHRRVIGTLHEAVKAAGKRLVVRDFVRSPKDLDEVVSAAGASPEDVVISLKNTPHDYYPHFPHNPRIGNVGNHAQWIEYDVWGQFYGWGVFPCVLLDDIKKRIDYALEKGATGFIARTDWESISEGSAIESVNKLNLYAAAMLSRNPETDFREIYRAWLIHPVTTAFSADGVPSGNGAEGDGKGADIDKLRSILGRTWPVMEHGIYMGGCVFHEDSMFPIALDDAWWIMEENHSLADWDPSKKGALDMTAENVCKLIAEKEEALAQVRSLCQRIEEDGNRMGLAPRFYADLVTSFRMYVRYIEGFYHNARAAVLTKYALAADTEEARGEARAAVKDLAEYAWRLRPGVSRTELPHHAHMLLDPDRLDAMAQDLAEKLAGPGEDLTGETRRGIV